MQATEECVTADIILHEGLLSKDEGDTSRHRGSGGAGEDEDE